MQTMELTPGEQLGFEGLNALQTSDGTIFYVKRECNGDDELIYALSNGQIVTTAKSWEGDIDKYDAFGDAIYFLTYSQKIYKATFHSPAEIRVEFLRSVDKLETHEVGMLFSRIANGRKLVYRACDHPTKGIPLNLEDVENNNSEYLEIAAVLRGHVIMQEEVEEDERLSVRKLNKNVVTIETPIRISSIFANEDSPLIYLLTDKRQITVLNTETMKYASLTLSCPNTDAKDLSFWNIVGIHGNKITMWGKRAGSTSLFTAEISEESFIAFS